MTLNEFNNFYLALKKEIDERVKHPALANALLKYFSKTALSMDTILYMLEHQIYVLRDDDKRTEGLTFLFHADAFRVYLNQTLKGDK